MGNGAVPKGTHRQVGAKSWEDPGKTVPPLSLRSANTRRAHAMDTVGGPPPPTVACGT